MRHLLFIATMSLAGTALAQNQAPPAPAAGPGSAGPAGATSTEGVQFKQKTEYSFDDDLVEGDLVRPDGEFVDTRRSAKHSSLIKIRDNFVPEMLKSAEDI
ncbi:MAG TPA: hypothetical protein VH877_13630 [Polyangia bacterium]|jgi:hypothetical protein|nr:hypothetical protein [Polyangia bacterium]